MDTSNGRNTAMEFADSRAQLQLKRNVNVGRIMETLKRHLPSPPGHDDQELEKIVKRIEEGIYTYCCQKPGQGSDISSSYEWEICFMMQTMETIFQHLSNFLALYNDVNPPAEGSLDSTAATTGNLNGGYDWQEEVGQQIKAMKDLSLLDSAAKSSNRNGEDGQEEVYQKQYQHTYQLQQQQYMQKHQLTQQHQFHQHIQSHEDLVKAMNDLDLLDSTTESNNQNGEDWQEEVYQKIKAMKDLYLPDLNDMHEKLLSKLQQHDSLPQQPRNEQLEKLKVYKNMMERLMQFLQIPKHRILIGYKDKLGTYEKLIINVINSNRRKPTPPLQQTQAFPPPPMQSLQSQRQLKKLIKAMKDLDPLDAAAQTGNLNGEDWQEEVFQKINTLKDLYLPDVNNIQRKLSKLPQCDSLYQKVTKEQHEKLKVYKNLLDRYVQFLQVPKHEISPYHKDKLGNYEMQIANVVRLKRRRQAALQPEAQEESQKKRK